MTMAACGRMFTLAGPAVHEARPAGLIEWPLLPDAAPDGVNPRTDLFGNEVLPAVGDYGVDAEGDLYERHSPDTEISRLTPPGT